MVFYGLYSARMQLSDLTKYNQVNKSLNNKSHDETIAPPAVKKVAALAAR